jgi:hypothetical protein
MKRKLLIAQIHGTITVSGKLIHALYVLAIRVYIPLHVAEVQLVTQTALELYSYYAGRWGARCESIILNYYVFVVGKIVLLGDDLIPI